MNDFGSLVASTEHGAALETFLDEKLGREKHLATTVPSYISTDDDFAAPPPDPPGEAEAEAAAAQEQEDVVSSSGPPKLGRALLKAKKKYVDFTAEENLGSGWNALQRSEDECQGLQERDASPCFFPVLCAGNVCALQARGYMRGRSKDLGFREDG